MKNLLKNFKLINEAHIVNNQVVFIAAAIKHNVFSNLILVNTLAIEKEVTKELENRVVHELYANATDILLSLKTKTVENEDGSKTYIPEFDIEADEWFILKDGVRVSENDTDDTKDAEVVESSNLKVVKKSKKNDA